LQSFSISFGVPSGQRPVFIPTKNELGADMFSFTRPHLFHLLTEEGVAAMFLRTVAADVEQAKAFVSKNSAVDLDALQNVLGHCAAPMINLKKASYGLNSGRKTRSILLGGQNCILHLHMVEEPDQFGPWKIYGVDRECR